MVVLGFASGLRYAGTHSSKQTAPGPRFRFLRRGSSTMEGLPAISPRPRPWRAPPEPGGKVVRLRKKAVSLWANNVKKKHRFQWPACEGGGAYPPSCPRPQLPDSKAVSGRCWELRPALPSPPMAGSGSGASSGFRKAPLSGFRARGYPGIPSPFPGPVFSGGKNLYIYPK